MNFNNGIHNYYLQPYIIMYAHGFCFRNKIIRIKHPHLQSVIAV